MSQAPARLTRLEFPTAWRYGAIAGPHCHQGREHTAPHMYRHSVCDKKSTNPLIILLERDEELSTMYSVVHFSYCFILVDAMQTSVVYFLTPPLAVGRQGSKLNVFTSACYSVRPYSIDSRVCICSWAAALFRLWFWNSNFAKFWFMLAKDRLKLLPCAQAQQRCTPRSKYRLQVHSVLCLARLLELYTTVWQSAQHDTAWYSAFWDLQRSEPCDQVLPSR